MSVVVGYRRSSLSYCWFWPRLHWVPWCWHLPSYCTGGVSSVTTPPAAYWRQCHHISSKRPSVKGVQMKRSVGSASWMWQKQRWKKQNSCRPAWHYPRCTNPNWHFKTPRLWGAELLECCIIVFVPKIIFNFIFLNVAQFWILNIRYYSERFDFLLN